MPGRREVNVERPEHSWIPFYRELARKLARGWLAEDRQPGSWWGCCNELQGRTECRCLAWSNIMEERHRPFYSVCVCFRVILRFENTTFYVLTALKTEFGLVSKFRAKQNRSYQ